MLNRQRYSLFVLLYLSQNVSANIISCEGFVKANGIPFDPSKVQIKLFTLQGNLKYETECNPSNGYYMIPIYNKGRYIIKAYAADGWIFEPEFQEVEINSNSDCSKDINFELYGFKISGIVGNGKQQGPRNFGLGLYDEIGLLLSRTSTQEAGYYEFRAKPGKYVVSTVDESVQCLERGKVPVELIDSPVIVKPDIRISGYNLKVVVKDDGNSKVTGASVTLISDSSIQLDIQPIKSEKPTIGRQGTKWLYTLKTDQSEGIVHFHCLPSGSYSITVKWSSDNFALNFDELIFEINSEPLNLVIKSPDFNIWGRVFAGEEPIPGAEISVKGVPNTVSDEKGTFVLAKLTRGRYKLTAVKEHFQFDDIEMELPSKSAEKVSLNFNAKKISVCGSVTLEGENDDPVSLEFTDKSNGRIADIVKLQGGGQFCRLLSPGSYSIKPSMANSDLSLTPKAYDIQLRHSPIFGMNFSQFRANILGSVSCFEKCKNVLVKLWNGRELVTEVSTAGSFKMANISPGKYSLKVYDDSNIWWDRAEIDLQVVDKDMHGLEFRQTGYVKEVQASHPALFEHSLVSGAKESPKFVELSEGLNSVFFPKAGKYVFTMKSCHEFSSASEDNQIVIPSEDRLVLTARNSLISVLVRTNEKRRKGDQLEIAVSDMSSGDQFSVTEANSSGNDLIFPFRLDQEMIGHEFIVSPNSNRFLFRPASYSFKFDGDCLQNITNFKAEVGKFIRGSIRPPIQGVEIIATHREDASLNIRMETDIAGHYEIGPIWSKEDFSIVPMKEGFDFNRDKKDPFNFDSFKLSQLKVSFVDSETKGSLANVLISLSGESNFRSNNITDETGTINFVGLAPGEYFIRPILQEYKFNSTSFAVTVKAGEMQEVLLEGKRFAYSAFGKVSTLNGDPISSILRIEAVAKGCDNHQEEDLTDPETSEFRIRALRPNCIYRISLKDEEGNSVEAFPPIIEILTKAEDNYGMNFVVIPKMNVETTTIFGRVVFERVEPPSSSYRVTLSEGNEVVQDAVIHSQASVFVFMNLPLKKDINYSVGIEWAEAKRLKSEPMSVEFKAESSFKYVKLTMRPERRSTEVEVSKANFFGLALIVCITASVYYNKYFKNLPLIEKPNWRIF